MINAFEYQNLNPGATVLRSIDPTVLEKPRAPIHVHTYGGETPFFKGLTKGKLMATKCNTKGCPAGDSGEAMLPPRVYCPDCLELMEWVEIKDPEAEIYTHISVSYPGAFNRLDPPCHLISISIKGVSTVLMSHLKEGEPEIGMKIEPRFNTYAPTYTIFRPMVGA